MLGWRETLPVLDVPKVSFQDHAQTTKCKLDGSMGAWEIKVR